MYLFFKEEVRMTVLGRVTSIILYNDGKSHLRQSTQL